MPPKRKIGDDDSDVVVVATTAAVVHKNKNNHSSSPTTINITTKRSTTIKTIKTTTTSSSSSSKDQLLVLSVVEPEKEDSSTVPRCHRTTFFQLDQWPDTSSWKDFLLTQASQPYFIALETFLTRVVETCRQTIFPPRSLMLAALTSCPLTSVKIVILGQDPYHNVGQAHGLSFSVPTGQMIPPSLRNMLKELASDDEIIPPFNHPGPRCGDLSAWCAQGVLLLNTVLSVKAHTPNSHAKQGWETFTNAIIAHVNTTSHHVVFMLWGKSAHAKVEMIDTSRHCILQTSHPSPLSNTKTSAPFSTSRCFSRANTYLTSHGQTPVVWQL